ncbi:hypothetical protein DOY81_011846 [Sarcophaga bullata]|nr:hypothetical protein DOY81_011846 [Sarcophaga bullata]
MSNIMASPYRVHPSWPNRTMPLKWLWAVCRVVQSVVQVQFTVDAGDAGEGNLEITISAKGQNIPTQVHPRAVQDSPFRLYQTEACEHT